MMLRSIVMCKEAAKRGVGYAYYFPGCAKSIDTAPAPAEFVDFLATPNLKVQVAKSLYILASSANIVTDKVPPPLLGFAIVRGLVQVIYDKVVELSVDAPPDHREGASFALPSGGVDRGAVTPELPDSADDDVDFEGDIDGDSLSESDATEDFLALDADEGILDMLLLFGSSSL